MTMRVIALGLVLAGACAKTQMGTETGNPPVISASHVSVEAIGEGRVRVIGEAGAIQPGGGEVSIVNKSRDGEPVVAEVAKDGSFSAELDGDVDDEYELVASNAAGRSPVRTVGGSSAPWQELHACDDADPMDQVAVTDLRIEDDTLHVDVSYGGGCEEHVFGLCYGTRWTGSIPTEVDFFVLHDGGGDTCNAAFSEQLSFDLTPFRDAYEERMTTDGGTAILRFPSCMAETCSVLYQFGDAAQDCGPPIGPSCPPFELPAAPAAWIEHPTECRFSFRGPDDLMALDVQGVDSCVAEFENGDCSFHVGSGGYSNGLTEFEDAGEYRVGRTTVDGFDAKVVTAFRDDQPRPYVAGAHFPDPPFATSSGVTADLVIFCASREAREAMLPALGTVRFD